MSMIFQLQIQNVQYSCQPPGVTADAVHERVTNAFIMERASVSTMPFAVDDPAAETSKQYNLSEALVDLEEEQIQTRE